MGRRQLLGDRHSPIATPVVYHLLQEGRCKATLKTEFKRKAGPPNHHDDRVDSDQ